MRKPVFLLIALVSLAVPSANAFVFYLVGNNPLRWNVNSTEVSTNVVNPITKKVRYFIASDFYSASNKTNEWNAIRACFAQWSSVRGSNLQFEEGGLAPVQTDTVNDNMNTIFWAKKSLYVYGGLVNLSGRRGWTYVTFSSDGSILDADIILNGIQYEWFTDFNNSSNQAQFVESILLHEIGHFVGLDHSPAGGATVANGPNGIGTQAGLSADEVAAMRYLYPDTRFKWASIRGKVTSSGTGVFGAIVVAEDSAGNIAGATVTRSDGSYDIFSLPAGAYNLRATPFDPSNASNNDSLMRPGEVADDYASGQTSFLPTANLSLTLTNGETRAQNIAVTGSNPPFRIASLSLPSSIQGLISVSRTALSIKPGQSAYLAVSGASIPSTGTLQISGDGLTVGPTTFYSNKPTGKNSLEARVQVSPNATAGLRSFVVSNGGSLAYANGYLEVEPAFPDYNFDGLDDRYQRQYWAPWTRTEARASSDPDGDHFSNEYEFRSNTNPTNSASWSFRIDSVRQGRYGTVVTWNADIGKKYQVYSRPVFDVTNGWTEVGGPVTATNAVMSINHPNPQPSRRFYRLQQLP
jgi:hypothetical protein